MSTRQGPTWRKGILAAVLLVVVLFLLAVAFNLAAGIEAGPV